MSIPYLSYTPALLEPTILHRNLERENLAWELVQKNAALNRCLHPITIQSLAKLMQSMNSYYSNLIEGHITKLKDIERSLAGDYFTDPKKRDLQLEAVAYIEVQILVDQKMDQKINHQSPTSSEFLCWIHQEFYQRLPQSLAVVMGDSQNEAVNPGNFRNLQVSIGDHIPPPPETLITFMSYFDQVYGNLHLSQIERVLASAAAHHRFLWIHPFLDGNGRVARIFSHAYLRSAGIDNQLWSISRGLARQVEKYRELLAIADQQRHNDYDGRGNLSLSGLTKFTQFFLHTCIDQIDFISSRLQLDKLLDRIELWTAIEIKAGKIKSGSFLLLKAALLEGSIPRGKAALITGREERQARTILKSLLDRGVLESSTARGNLLIAFIADVVDDWLPGLM